MTSTASDEAGSSLPEPMTRLLADYERHLVSERDLTPHTVRAYLGDIGGLLDHAGRMGITDIGELDLRTLRSWLARQQTSGLSRTTLARRATAARVFTAWLARTGRIPADVGATLGSPRSRRTLPSVLRTDEAAELVTAAAARADDGSPTGLRDVAMLELLYATGIRVGELVGLDLDDLDRDRDLVRVLGKGRKERSVPFGRPARAALDRWLSQRPAGSADGRLRARRCSWGLVAAGSTSGPCARWCTGGSRTCRALPTSARTGCGTPRPPTCSRAAPTSGRSRSCSGTPRWPPPSSTPTSPRTGCERRTAKPTPEPDVAPRPGSSRQSGRSRTGPSPTSRSGSR